MSEQIGNDIRALRKSRGMTLGGLSGLIGRSVGWLSQVERGQAAPSVQDLGAIAGVFGLSISFFFRAASRNPREQGLIQRGADRMAIGSQESGLVEELLSPTLSGAFEMIRSTFAPGSDSGGLRAASVKEDGGVLIQGRLLLTIADCEFDLAPGDSFQFAGKPYAWRNPGAEPAIVIWIVAPPVY